MQYPLCFWVILPLLLTMAQATAQDSSDLNWQDAFSEIEIVDGKLAGPGKDAFLQQCQECNFVMFGEAHGIDGVAKFVAATHMALNNDAFHYLVLESGDWFTTQLAAEATDSVLKKYPYALAFDYDGDIQLIEQADFMGRAQASWVIGIDQEAGAIHPFQFLGSKAKSRAARRLARALHLKALFQGGAYIKSDSFADLEKLKSLVDGDPASCKLVESIEDSMSIYHKHVSGAINDSVSQRELRMMKLIDEAVAGINKEADASLRLLFKMGGAHLTRGIGPNGVETVGEHIAQFARAKGQKSFHIGIHTWSEQTAIPIPDKARNFPYVFVDGIALRKLLAANTGQTRQPKLTKELIARLDHFDAFILLPEANRASKSRIRFLQNQFVRRSLLSFSSFLIPLFVLIPVFWSSFRNRIPWLRKKKDDDKPWLRCLPALVSFGMLTMIVWQVYLSALSPKSALVSSTWFVALLDSACILSMIAIVLVAIRMQLKSWWTSTRRMLFWLGCISCLFLGAYMYYWNIGGLLGI